MIEANAGLWTFPADVRCVTTNGAVDKYNRAIMGAGVARQARDRYPQLALELGRVLRHDGNQVYYWPKIALFTFPTKNNNWRAPSDIELIKRSCGQLMWLLDANTSIRRVNLPRPGCMNGQLLWEDVKPRISPLLDDRVVIVSL